MGGCGFSGVFGLLAIFIGSVTGFAGCKKVNGIEVAYSLGGSDLGGSGLGGSGLVMPMLNENWTGLTGLNALGCLGFS